MKSTTPVNNTWKQQGVWRRGDRENIDHGLYACALTEKEVLKVEKDGGRG